MRHNLLMHMLAGDDADALAVEIHTRSCLRTRFHSKTISRSGGLGDCLQRLDTPLLVAWGEHDVTVMPTEAALVQAGVAVRTEVIGGAGHWAQYQAANRINALLIEWLGGAGEGAPMEVE